MNQYCEFVKQNNIKQNYKGNSLSFIAFVSLAIFVMDMFIES